MTRLTDEQLRKLSTKRLLTYFKKHRNTICWDDLEDGEEPDEYMNRIREILSSREHVEK